MSKLILEQHRDSLIQHLIANGLAASQPRSLQIEDLLNVPPPQWQGTLPFVTVAVCTRDRPSDLALCLDALNQLDYPALDLLVVDNAPASDATEQLVRQYPTVRYVCEPRPGLDWARNRAILEAKGEILAYTDDDVVVDAGWIRAIATVFAENPEVMAVTGLVVPYELETDAQVLFEHQGGFGRGCDRRWYRAEGHKMPWQLLGTGQMGTGANMAYRRSLFQETGGFDPALDVGTLTQGAGDLEMFFRVLKSGHTLVYEPSAIVRHRHRRTIEQLRSQLTHNGSVYAFFVCGAFAYPEDAGAFLRVGLSWLWSGNLFPLIVSLFSPNRFPADLILAQLWGCLISLTRYQKSCKIAAEIADTFGELTVPISLVPISLPERSSTVRSGAMAVQIVELTQPLVTLELSDYWNVRIFVTWKGNPLGSLDIVHQYQPISITRLSMAIAKNLGQKLLDPDSLLPREAVTAAALTSLIRHYTPAEDTPERGLSANVPVSIVIGTYDRPEDLRNCLQSLVRQKSERAIEIIVADNHPISGLTPPVVAEFPGVALVSEPRQGVAYARNAGIVNSRGEIVVTVDDDVTLPDNWLEKLIAPFTRADVMTVTGNVLPLELTTDSQQLFERYGNGGLGRGFERFEANRDWFERSWKYAVPTWELGATANAAFRASIFHHPKIGLMDETLGPGMPSGVGEDIYLFYKVLKAGYTIVYEPTAYVWHKHRRDRSALRRQLYNYSKGYTSYQLTTVLHDRDFRALFNLLIVLPPYYLKRILRWLIGDRTYPLSLIGLEMAGNLAGAWALWRSHQRVRREGRSAPYVPVTERVSERSQQPIRQPVSLQSSILETYGS